MWQKGENNSYMNSKIKNPENCHRTSGLLVHLCKQSCLQYIEIIEEWNAFFFTSIPISRTLFVATMCDQLLCSRKCLYPNLLQMDYWFEPAIPLEIQFWFIRYYFFTLPCTISLEWPLFWVGIIFSWNHKFVLQCAWFSSQVPRTLEIALRLIYV